MNPYEPAEPAPQPSEEIVQAPKDDKVGCGILYWPLGLAITFFSLSLLGGFFRQGELALTYLALISGTQLLFVLPMSLYFLKANKRRALKGFLGTAAVVCLINGGCLTFIYSSM